MKAKGQRQVSLSIAHLIYLNFSHLFILCVFVGSHMQPCVWRSRRTTYRNWFSPTLWGLEIKPRWSGLAASAFTPWVILPTGFHVIFLIQGLTFNVKLAVLPGMAGQQVPSFPWLSLPVMELQVMLLHLDFYVSVGGSEPRSPGLRNSHFAHWVISIALHLYKRRIKSFPKTHIRMRSHRLSFRLTLSLTVRSMEWGTQELVGLSTWTWQTKRAACLEMGKRNGY